jgi:hypothetical protein
LFNSTGVAFSDEGADSALIGVATVLLTLVAFFSVLVAFTAAGAATYLVLFCFGASSTF